MVESMSESERYEIRKMYTPSTVIRSVLEVSGIIAEGLVDFAKETAQSTLKKVDDALDCWEEPLD